MFYRDTSHGRHRRDRTVMEDHLTGDSKAVEEVFAERRKPSTKRNVRQRISYDIPMPEFGDENSPAGEKEYEPNLPSSSMSQTILEDHDLLEEISEDEDLDLDGFES